jgi:hypothetical protein
MGERPFQQQTLREILVDAERFTRELAEHLDQAFIPKCHELNRLVRPINGEPPDLDALEDVTVRTQVGQILESEAFSATVFEKLDNYCQAIDNAVSRIMSEG